MSLVQFPWQEHRPVTVLLDDGRRVEGWLEAWRKDPDGWRGWVRYSTGQAETRVGWFPGEGITPSY